MEVRREDQGECIRETGLVLNRLPSSQAYINTSARLQICGHIWISGAMDRRLPTNHNTITIEVHKRSGRGVALEENLHLLGALFLIETNICMAPPGSFWEGYILNSDDEQHYAARRMCDEQSSNR